LKRRHFPSVHVLYQRTTLLEAAEKHQTSPEGTTEFSPDGSPGYQHVVRIVQKGRLNLARMAVLRYQLAVRIVQKGRLNVRPVE
jgi:hypothetical protein